jgi:hypothetical protein
MELASEQQVVCRADRLVQVKLGAPAETRQRRAGVN